MWGFCQWARPSVPGGSEGFGRALPEDHHAGANRALANSASCRDEPNVEACQVLLKHRLTELANPVGLIARVGLERGPAELGLTRTGRKGKQRLPQKERLLATGARTTTL